MKTCKFCSNVDCQLPVCEDCGWNPKVAEARVKKWQIQRNLEKAEAKNK